MGRVLITGGAGFIGSHTADSLIGRGNRVRVLDILDPQIHGPDGDVPKYLNPEVEFIRGDVCNQDDLATALEDVEVVYHFAAKTGVGQSMYEVKSYVDANCGGTASLLEAILTSNPQVKRVILSSSRAVYGEGTHNCAKCGIVYPPQRQREDMEHGRMDVFCPSCGEALVSVPTSEDRPLEPISVYGWTKKHQEDLCKHVAATRPGLTVVCLRYFNVYGSRQSLKNPYTGVVSIFYNRLVAGQPISIYENGVPGRDFVHISDVVRANLLAMDAAVESGSCMNVGTGVESTIWDIAHSLAKATECQGNFEDRGEFRVGDIRSCYGDIRRAQSRLGYEPRVDLETGMKEFVAWAEGQESVDLYKQTVDELERHGLFGRAAGTS